MRVRQSAAAGILLIAVLACDSPTQPTDGVTPDFIIATGMNVVPIGGSTRLTVTAYTRSQELHAFVKGVQQAEDISTAATWSSDNPAVATISSRTIVGRTAGMTNLRASYMGREYAMPLYVVAPSGSAQHFAGTWSGVAKRFCNDLIGNTRSCYEITGTPYVGTVNVSVSLNDLNGVLQGSIDIGGGQWSHLVGRVVGGVTATGELVLGGAPRLGDHGHERAMQLRDWRFSRSGRELRGSGTSESGFVNIYGVVWQRVTYPEITLR
jgi:hypothetical protein